jgi:hypothetical protein
LLASSPTLQEISGTDFQSRGRPGRPSALARDELLQERALALGEQLVTRVLAEVG